MNGVLDRGRGIRPEWGRGSTWVRASSPTPFSHRDHWHRVLLAPEGLKCTSNFRNAVRAPSRLWELSHQSTCENLSSCHRTRQHFRERRRSVHAQRLDGRLRECWEEACPWSITTASLPQPVHKETVAKIVTRSMCPIQSLSTYLARRSRSYPSTQ